MSPPTKAQHAERSAKQKAARALDRLPIAGEETSAGQPRHCNKCDQDMGNGPDACMGYLPGVFAACCGHGTDFGYILFTNGMRVSLSADAEVKDNSDMYKGSLFLGMDRGKITIDDD